MELNDPQVPTSATPMPGMAQSRGGNLDDLRRRNLAAVLRLAHQTGGLSRADLTRETGLNRSTVGALVADLAAAGHVQEGQVVRSGVVGRPSPLVVPTDLVKVLAINPEIDATSGWLVGMSGKVLGRIDVVHDHVPTPEDVVAATVQIHDEFMAELGGETQIQGVGLAVPGLVARASGSVVVAPHLGWRDVPLGHMVAQALGLPAVVDNDAHCGAIAESIFGAGTGTAAAVYLNGGASGIGGGILAGGVLLGGHNGFGGEFGHTLVNSAGAPCHCGASGCLETEVHRSRLLAVLSGVEAGELDAQLQQRSRNGERDVVAEVDRQLGYLAIALRTVVNVINPQRIILGGFLASLMRARGTRVLEAELSRTMAASAEPVQIQPAQLGENILAVGAAELVLSQVIAAPLD